MPVTYPATHVSISSNCPYPIFLVPTQTPTNCTTLTPNRFLTLSFPVLIIIILPPARPVFLQQCNILPVFN